MAFTSRHHRHPKGRHAFPRHDAARPPESSTTRGRDRSGGRPDLLPLGLNWANSPLLQSFMPRARRAASIALADADALWLIERERGTFHPPGGGIAHRDAKRSEPGAFRSAVAAVVITGGAACPVENIRAFRARIPGNLIRALRLLETGLTPHALDGRSRGRRRHIGRRHQKHGTALIRRDGRERAAGRRGRGIAAKGPSVAPRRLKEVTRRMLS